VAEGEELWSAEDHNGCVASLNKIYFPDGSSRIELSVEHRYSTNPILVLNSKMVKDMYDVLHHEFWSKEEKRDF
jgi:hypothetical protein